MDDDLKHLSREALIAEVKKLRVRHSRPSRQQRTGSLLAPSATLGTVAGANGPIARRAGLAAVHPRLRPLPAITRRSTAGCATNAAGVQKLTGLDECFSLSGRQVVLNFVIPRRLSRRASPVP